MTMREDAFPVPDAAPVDVPAPMKGTTEGARSRANSLNSSFHNVSCALRSDDTDAPLIMPDWFGFRASVEPDEICGGPAEAEVARELSR